ncbi:helix-turn-helix transcriptional regulator [Fulvivirga sp. 29W222]|uniref:Helix-turn-helix transcriptional regulator n=1 Tax=Fulvivirga marina TaxID=2494733 RepID=A0A937KCV9_9BACT|nr:helix-turn-helix domain-containing protein [Fulvivirga marina]MBL6445400.1 helix-turn-helix transcriptional regulator [Fulvivirga marina]
MGIPNNKFAYYRKKRGLTQFDVLAEIQRVTGKKFRQGTISSWENGKTVPSMQILQILAGVLEVQIDDLYEKPEKADRNSITLPPISTLQHQIDSTQEQYDTGEMDEAYLRLKAISEDMLERLSQISHEYEKLKGKLKTAQDVLNL